MTDVQFEEPQATVPSLVVARPTKRSFLNEFVRACGINEKYTAPIAISASILILLISGAVMYHATVHPPAKKVPLPYDYAKYHARIQQ